MRVVSYNIQFGGRGREQAIAQVLRAAEPDVVVLQEATDTRVVERVAHAANLPFWFSRRGFSVALLSRQHVAHCYWHRTYKTRHPILEAAIGGLTVFGVHLQPYFSGWSERRRIREIATLVKMAEPYRDRPHLLLGDFNAIAPSDVVDMRRMPRRVRMLIQFSGGVIRTSAIRSLMDMGYVDGFRALHPDEPGATLPAFSPHIRLDYAFLLPALLERLREITVIKSRLVPGASDHCPLLTVMDV
jgi:endonuclease/exonuclease/phosphatase family metal-dependent hydrolase